MNNVDSCLKKSVLRGTKIRNMDFYHRPRLETTNSQTIFNQIKAKLKQGPSVKENDASQTNKTWVQNFDAIVSKIRQQTTHKISKPAPNYKHQKWLNAWDGIGEAQKTLYSTKNVPHEEIKGFGDAPFSAVLTLDERNKFGIYILCHIQNV